MSGRIHVLSEDGKLAPLDEAPYELEDVLPSLLADHPDLLAGDQTSPSSPRRWLLVSREARIPDNEGGVGRWAVDHLFLDQDGVPTLVEVKRSSDTRVRREVVGQMLDYAANAMVYWPADHIRGQFEQRCSIEGRDPDLVLHEALDVTESDDYWERVATNLQAHRVRMVFVADEIPPELQRIVEFLNEQMTPAEVLAVEVRQFAGRGLKTLVPRVLGMTAEAEQRKVSARRRDRWTAEEFDADLRRRRGEEQAAAAAAIRRWADDRGLRIAWGQGRTYGTFSPNMDRPPVQDPMFGVNTDGKIEILFAAIKQTRRSIRLRCANGCASGSTRYQA
jgi:hypothetical protein